MIPAVKKTNLWNLIIFITWDLELSTQSRGSLTFPILQMPALRLRVKKTPTPQPLCWERTLVSSPSEGYSF